MDPREFAEAQNRETRKITATVRRVVVQNGAPVTSAQREAMAEQLLPKVKRARVRVRDLGVDFMETQADAAGAALEPQPIRDYESRAIVKVLERVTGVPEEKSEERRKVSVTMADPKTRADVRKRVTVTDENRHDPVVTKAVGERAAASVERHVRNAAREAVSDAAELAGTEIGWARVLSGAESCPFCAMLASRGPVYGSEESAGAVTERSKRYDAAEAKAYHDNCDCIVVPVFEGVPWYGQEHYEALEDLWIESTSGLSAPDSAKAFAAALKKTNLALLPDSDTDTSEVDGAGNAIEPSARRRNVFDPGEAEAESARRKAREAAEMQAWLDAERAYEESRPLSAATRALIERSRSDLPQGREGWDKLQTLSKDANGAFVPSRRLKAHLETVTAVGKAVYDDVERRLAADVELVNLRNQREALVTESDEHLKASRFLDMLRASQRKEDVNREIAQRESAAILEALSDVRDFGGFKQTVRTLTESDRTRLQQLSGIEVEAVDADALALLREAERFYPTEWLRAADERGSVGLGYVDRGFFLQKDANTLPHDTIVVTPRGGNPYAGGAHSDEATETMIHELGHRMEMAIPGLTQLEFALARSRATRNGLLEPLTEIDPYAPGEVAYKDEWTNAYAGRSYAPAGSSRPDLVAHEVFQVGTQDLYGRSITKFGDGELQDFMMGVLALL